MNFQPFDEQNQKIIHHEQDDEWHDKDEDRRDGEDHIHIELVVTPFTRVA